MICYRHLPLFLILFNLIIQCSTKNIEQPVVVVHAHQRIEVSNVEELQLLKPQRGDTIHLIGDGWANSKVVLKGEGSEKEPIVFRVDTPYQSVFSGISTLIIDGSWIVADGFLFKDGYSVGRDVIVFSKNSSNCTLVDAAIINYNPQDSKVDYKWVSLYGSNNTVTNCEFTGKTNLGTTLVVWLDGYANNHIISNNYFGARPELGANGGETIRIGTSQWSMSPSGTIVKYNIFDNCDGEIEVISVKSCSNIIEENFFYECSGTLTLRHGNDNIVRGNFFIGNNKSKTGGIRVIGERQIVEGNYLYQLKGKSLRAALSVMNAIENPELNEYFQVTDSRIEDNIVLQCTEGIAVGAGANEKGKTVPPKNITITGNLLQDVTTVISYESTPINSIIADNKTNNKTIEKGFISLDKILKRNMNGLYIDEIPFWLKKDIRIGVSWKNPQLFPVN